MFYLSAGQRAKGTTMSTFQIGDKVSKVNVNGKVGSATVYEVATVTSLSDMSAITAGSFADEATDGVVYTLRKVGGRGKGGCWYSVAQLVAA